MIFDNLTDDNILLYAMKSYESPNCVMSEFAEDFERIKYIKKLISKYKTKNILKERLILNHIICLANVFGVYPATRILFFKIDKSDYDILKTFLVFLDYMPNIIFGIKHQNISSIDIPINIDVDQNLRKI